MKLSEIDFPMARSKLLEKDLPSKDVLKTLPKTLKRQSKQISYLDDTHKRAFPKEESKVKHK